MKITFKNTMGVVTFAGGGDFAKWHITDVAGLALPHVNVETVSYYGEHGYKTVKKTLAGRCITITAEVKGDTREKRAKIVSEALKVMAHDGVLVIETHSKRVCDCYLSNMSEGERKGAFRTYVFQFMSDSPYFRDEDISSYILAGRENLFEDPFTIGDGIILTKRWGTNTITNDSDVDIEGKLYIYTGDASGSLRIVNETTGGELLLNVKSEKNYVIDIERREIYDEEGNNCIDILGEESYLSDFYLARGSNKISCYSSSSGLMVYLQGKIEFYKKYVEATD